jgi:hypothetical protein
MKPIEPIKRLIADVPPPFEKWVIPMTATPCRAAHLSHWLKHGSDFSILVTINPSEVGRDWVNDDQARIAQRANRTFKQGQISLQAKGSFYPDASVGLFLHSRDNSNSIKIGTRPFQPGHDRIARIILGAEYNYRAERSSLLGAGPLI